jgi:DNA-binding MurR/RpiR family transcriptional regulator
MSTRRRLTPNQRLVAMVVIRERMALPSTSMKAIAAELGVSPRTAYRLKHQALNRKA